MKKLPLLLVVLQAISLNLSSQNSGLAFDLGYTYNRKNWINIGVSGTYFNTRPYAKSAWDVWHIGGGLGLNGGFSERAKGHFSVYANGGSSILDTKVVASKYYINPAIGLTVANYGKIHVGYSIPLKELKGVTMRGFTISFIISIGSDGYYMDLTS